MLALPIPPSSLTFGPKSLACHGQLGQLWFHSLKWRRRARRHRGGRNSLLGGGYHCGVGVLEGGVGREATGRGTRETRRCSLLNRGTSTQRRHDDHSPDLHMHKKLKQVSAHLQTHTDTHTRVRAWHRPGTTGDAPRHMHTRLDRQAPAVPPGVLAGGEEPETWSCQEGPSFWFPGRSLHWGWSRGKALSAAQHGATLSSSRAACRHTRLLAGGTGLCGTSHDSRSGSRH